MDDIGESNKQRSRARWQLALAGVALIVVSVVLWRFTSLAQLAEPARLAVMLEGLRASVWAPPVMAVAIVVATLMLFPITGTFVVTAMILDTPLAVCTSLAGALGSAIVGYAIGARYFRNATATAVGWRLGKVQEILRNRGTLAIAMARFIPVAPYLAFSIAAGAVSVRLRDFMVGTGLAVLPVIVMLTLFEAQVRELVTRPTLTGLALLLGLITLWVLVILGMRRMVASKDPR